MRPPTLLRVLLEKQGWSSWTAFETHFARAAQQAAQEFGNHRLNGLTISNTTFKRWLSGDQIPRGDARMVLEFMLGVTAEQLLQPAPTHEVVTPRAPHRSSLASALALDSAWATSALAPASPAPGMDGVWRLSGIDLFDGTSVAVQMYEASALDDVVLIGPEDHPHLTAFVKPARRALVLGSLGADGGAGLYVLDAAYARRHLAVDRPVDTLPIPRAYGIDDLTYGIVWAMLNVDDGLLADDHALESERQDLDHQLAKRRSAVARSAAPELSAIGSSWLGSFFCSLYSHRHLPQSACPPLSWSREQRGEEAAPLLFFRHLHDSLERTGDAHARGGEPCGHAFCVPETVVKESERYERTLLFLAVALLEKHGITAWICREPEYAQIDAFALIPGERAIVSNWLRADGIWQVEATNRRSEVHTYGQAIEHARKHTVAPGATPARRLRALADYLDLDWSWLVRRCNELAQYGIWGMLRPRSRLLSLDALDATLRFVGGFDADNGRG